MERCLWIEVCYERHIYWTMSRGCVGTLLSEYFRQFRGALVVGLLLFLCYCSRFVV
jgi:hypothetical protein